MPLLNLPLMYISMIIVFEDMAWHDSASCHVVLCYVEHVFLDKYTRVKSIISKEKIPI